MTDSSRAEKLSHAYHHTLERLRARLQAAEDQSLPLIQQGIEEAAETAAGIQSLTQEELDLLKAYVRRDVADAGAYLATTGADLRSWLRFDLEQVEERFLEWFTAAADRSRLEYLQFTATLEGASHYRSGEITGPGTLHCENCGHSLSFHQPQAIPPCAQCGHRVFIRDSVEDGAAQGE